jgi:threonine dehydratase
VRERVDEVVTVTDEDIARAVLLLVERAKQVVEPSGAAGLAAVLGGAATLVGPVVVILGGGNVDPLLLLRILQSGMSEEGRYFAFRTQLDDSRGRCRGCSPCSRSSGANVVAIAHHRLGTARDLLQVEVQLELETRGPEHIAEVQAALADRGYRLD